MEDIFKNATKSGAPIYIKVTRIEQFKYGCGRLRAEMKQDGVKNDKGELVEIDPWFEVNICPDGNPPAEKIREMEHKKRSIIQACKVRVEKNGIDNDSGAAKAFLRASGCPVSGMSHWRYTGDCDALKMPDNISTNTPITKTGKIDIELRIPRNCQSKRNAWRATIQNQEGMILGDVGVSW